LKVAGIPYVDDAGLYADFHALRHSYISLITQGGVHPKLAQRLARHSDINLTMSRYSHTVMADEAEALEVLPEFPSMIRDNERQSHTLRATGTDDLGVSPGQGDGQNPKRSSLSGEKRVLPENRPERDAIPVISMHRDAVDDVVEPADSATGSAKKKPAKHGKNRELQGSESGEGGIRTPGASFPAHRISNPAQSATLAPPLAAHPQASYGDVAVTL